MNSAAILLSLSLLASSVHAQQVGAQTAEVHPALTWQKCTKSGGCVTRSSGEIVLDANWRWVHTTSGYTNCYTGNRWDSTLCPHGPVNCATNCALDGADYSGTYGITTSGNALTLKFITTNSNGKNVGTRVYLLQDDSTYQMFKVKNQEFTFDVDVSNLPCGLNGALYFSEMSADGGLSAYSGNKAGAKYGTGYCDAQCPKDIKFINGEANFITSDGTATGTLSEIRRLYVRNGKVIQNSKTNIAGMSPYDSVTDAFCAAQKTAFGDTNTFAAKGRGVAQMSKAFDQGMVLVMSVWDDHVANMLWLDSDYPTTASASSPGVHRGNCVMTSGVPADAEVSAASASVTYSNIRFGDIGSTYTGTGTSTTTTGNPVSSTTTSSAATSTATGTAAHYAQCGGIGYTGPTTCASPYTCVYSNAYYSQCL
ncbi:hypothetical protein FRC06_005367 [Ceratobasidium sp. 370]|nr:hypothetical protein FRC06_005367 [Ceratobasidium sp. 370]